jgi:hypothetical protein
MFRWKWILVSLLTTGSILASGQALTVNERLVQLADVLGKNAASSSPQKIRAIQEIGQIHVISSLASGLLFERANVHFETDPEVREAAALNLRFVCETRSRAAALRLGRFTAPATEPDPAVRIAALRSLACFQSAEAAASIYNAANEGTEPDPKVREAAKELIQKGLAGTLY